MNTLRNNPNIRRQVWFIDEITLESFRIRLHQEKLGSPGRKEIKSEFFSKFGEHEIMARHWEKIVANIPFIESSREYWKYIGNTNYQVSNKGRFRRIHSTVIRLLNPFKKDRCNKNGQPNRKSLMIKILSKEYSAARLVAEYWVDKASKDHNVVIQIDGNYDNIDATNLKWVTRSQMGSATGYSERCSREIIYQDESGNLTTFRSARSAAKALNCSYQTILDYCNNKVAKPVLNVKFEGGNNNVTGH